MEQTTHIEIYNKRSKDACDHYIMYPLVSIQVYMSLKYKTLIKTLFKITVVGSVNIRVHASLHQCSRMKTKNCCMHTQNKHFALY